MSKPQKICCKNCSPTVERACVSGVCSSRPCISYPTAKPCHTNPCPAYNCAPSSCSPKSCNPFLEAVYCLKFRDGCPKLRPVPKKPAPKNCRCNSKPIAKNIRERNKFTQTEILANANQTTQFPEQFPMEMNINQTEETEITVKPVESLTKFNDERNEDRTGVFKKSLIREPEIHNDKNYSVSRTGCLVQNPDHDKERKQLRKKESSITFENQPGTIRQSGEAVDLQSPDQENEIARTETVRKGKNKSSEDYRLSERSEIFKNITANSSANFFNDNKVSEVFEKPQVRKDVRRESNGTRPKYSLEKIKSRSNIKLKATKSSCVLVARQSKERGRYDSQKTKATVDEESSDGASSPETLISITLIEDEPLPSIKSNKDSTQGTNAEYQRIIRNKDGSRKLELEPVEKGNLLLEQTESESLITSSRHNFADKTKLDEKNYSSTALKKKRSSIHEFSDISILEEKKYSSTPHDLSDVSILNEKEFSSKPQKALSSSQDFFISKLDEKKYSNTLQKKKSYTPKEFKNETVDAEGNVKTAVESDSYEEKLKPPNPKMKGCECQCPPKECRPYPCCARQMCSCSCYCYHPYTYPMCYMQGFSPCMEYSFGQNCEMPCCSCNPKPNGTGGKGNLKKK